MLKDTDSSKDSVVPSRDSCGFLGRQLLIWNIPLLWRGWKRPVTADNAPLLPSLMSSSIQEGLIEAAWIEELKETEEKGKKPQFLRAFFRSCKGLFVCGCALAVFNGALGTMFRPLLLRAVVMSLQEDASVPQRTLLFVAMLAVSLLEGFTQSMHSHLIGELAFPYYYAGGSSLLCRKLRTAQEEAIKNQPSEQAIIGSDLQRSLQMARFVSWVIMGFAGVICGTSSLLYILGPAALGGVATMFLTLVMNHKAAGISGKHQAKAMGRAAARIEVLGRVVDAAKAVKFFSWEESYLEKLDSLRNEEVREIRKFRMSQVVSIAGGRSAPVLSSVVAIATYATFSENLMAADIFATISVFQALRLSLIILPNALVSMKVIVAANVRLQTYLQLPDQVERHTLDGSCGNAVEARNAVLSWDTLGEESIGCPNEPQSPTSPNFSIMVNVSIPRGKLVAVIGPVGTGKTTLLSAVVGDLLPKSGSVQAQKVISYVTQQAIIISGTVQENIVLGRPLDSMKLQQAVEAAELIQDLKIFPDGLHTEIGERGTSLSGGQRQRLSIARAIYNISDDALLVLDDPISALDAMVGHAVFKKVILAHRDRGGTVLVVLNQLQYLSKCDLVLSIDDGKLEEQAPPPQSHDDRQDHTAVDQLLEKDGSSNGVNGHGANEKVAKEGLPSRRTQIVLDEIKHQGKMKNSVSLEYIRSLGHKFVALTGFIIISGYAMMAFQDMWLAAWSQKKDQTDEQRMTSLVVYVCSAVAFAILILTASLMFAVSGAWASKSLHHRCLERMLHAPLMWWEGTPKGRITSRFSADLSQVDMELAFFFDNASQLSITTLVLLIIIVAVAPVAIAIVVPCVAAYGVLTEVVDRTNRELRRICNTAMAPVLSNLAECKQSRGILRLGGCSSSFFEERHRKYIDEWNRHNYSSSALLTFMKHCACFISTLISAAAGAWVLFADAADPAQAGIALTYSFLIPYFFGMGCQVVMMLKTLLSSLERLLEYLDLPQEADWNKPMDPKQTEWPEAGKIEFCTVTLRYRDNLPKALEDVSFVLPGGSKTGIIGRTGSGKSTVVAALFRLVDPCNGVIRIDERDITDVGLRCLRRDIAVVPQDPTLMQGSIHTNLNPFTPVPIEDARRALKSVAFASNDEEADQILAKEIDGSGSNLSCGERQLLCFARALLYKPKVLLLDEPTSSADTDTDAKIQAMIRKEFMCTILCIAHRLSTIADLDFTLVMNQGHVEEFGPPSELQKSGGLFAQMYEAAGLARDTALDPPAEVEKEPQEERSGYVEL